MSVILETTLGDLTVDLLVESCPLICQNFLKLCKVKYYNDTLFHRIERDFIAIAGSTRDEKETCPSNCGKTIWGLLDARYAGLFDGKPEEKWLKRLPDAIAPDLKHDVIGVLATANEEHNRNGSCFYITLAENLTSLDGKHTIFGYVVEGLNDVLLAKLNKSVVDHVGKPLQNIRIRHTIVIDDPLADPPHISRLIPERSPSPIRDIAYQSLHTVEDELRLLEKIGQSEARSRAIALEILGDIADADMKPPDNVLFICKLNPYTEEEDLQTIFAQFGEILSCNIIKDWKTGDSLQYGFIEFKDKSACENAYFKMKDVLIDDRRIHVDFCQTMTRQWRALKAHGDRATQQDAIDVNRTVIGGGRDSRLPVKSPSRNSTEYPEYSKTTRNLSRSRPHSPSTRRRHHERIRSRSPQRKRRRSPSHHIRSPRVNSPRDRTHKRQSQESHKEHRNDR